MQTTSETHLYQAAVLTFEELAFMFTDPTLSERQEEAPFQIGSELKFRGPFNGRLVVQLHGGVLPTLAQNVLAEEQTPDEQLQFDTLKEITNVICGNLLPRLAGAAAVFDLDPPTIFSVAVGSGDASASTEVGLEEGRAELLLFFEGDGAQEMTA